MYCYRSLRVPLLNDTNYQQLVNGTALHCTSLHRNALHCIKLHCTALHYTALHCSALHYTALHFTRLHCTALHCTVLHYTALRITEMLKSKFTPEWNNGREIETGWRELVQMKHELQTQILTWSNRNFWQQSEKILHKWITQPLAWVWIRGVHILNSKLLTLSKLPTRVLQLWKDAWGHICKLGNYVVHNFQLDAHKKI